MSPVDRSRGAVGRYIELGLALGRHIDGLVDAYYGPPEVAARIAAEPPNRPQRLVADARDLIAAIDGGGPLDDSREAVCSDGSDASEAPLVARLRWSAFSRPRGSSRAKRSPTPTRWSRVTGSGRDPSSGTRSRRRTGASTRSFQATGHSPSGSPRGANRTRSHRRSSSVRSTVLAEDLKERTDPDVRPARRRGLRFRARDRQAVVGLQHLSRGAQVRAST